MVPQTWNFTFAATSAGEYTSPLVVLAEENGVRGCSTGTCVETVCD